MLRMLGGTLAALGLVVAVVICYKFGFVEVTSSYGSRKRINPVAIATAIALAANSSLWWLLLAHFGKALDWLADIRKKLGVIDPPKSGD